jgi:hypothetical protein
MGLITVHEKYCLLITFHGKYIMMITLLEEYETERSKSLKVRFYPCYFPTKRLIHDLFHTHPGYHPSTVSRVDMGVSG